MTRTDAAHPRAPGVLWTLILLAAGCATGPDAQQRAAYRTVEAAPGRDTAAAIRANQTGLEHLARGELDAAASDFQQALTADVEYAPAHNNLGKVYFKQKDWYKAAWEFEYARKLAPRDAEPANNLGLVLEQVGELDRAVDQYRAATALEPADIQYLGNLARAMIRRGERTAEVRQLLQQVLERDTRPDWLIWARQQQAAMPVP